MPLSPCFSYKTNEGRFMLKPWRRRWRWAAWLAALAMTGCSTTRVESNHHLVSAASEAQFATVYFLRPGTERAAGFSDNTLTVEVDGSKLLTIDKGEYLGVHAPPRPHHRNAGKPYRSRPHHQRGHHERLRCAQLDTARYLAREDLVEEIRF